MWCDSRVNTEPSPPSRRLWRFRTMRRYLEVAVLSMGLNLLVLVTMHEGLGLREEAAYALALAASMVFNFFMLRHRVYESGGGKAHVQVAGFLATNGVFRLLEWVSYSLLLRFTPLHYVVASVGVSVVSTGLKYFAYVAGVFRKPSGGGTSEDSITNT